MFKVAPISGDCLKPNLGISESDRNLLQEEVSIVFHVAATVRFDAPLRDAAYINIRSTSDLLDIAKGMKNLKVAMIFNQVPSFCTYFVLFINFCAFFCRYSFTYRQHFHIVPNIKPSKRKYTNHRCSLRIFYQ